MSPRHVIGLVGQKGDGKDTCADILVNEFGYVKYCFSTPLKHACQYLFQCPDDVFNDPLLKESVQSSVLCRGKTPRQLLQWLGTDVFRQQHDERFWIHHLEHVLNSTEYENTHVVIPDVRFVNEARCVRNFPSSCLVKISRPHKTTHTEKDSHISETELNDIPSEWFVEHIVNDSSLDDYRQKCRVFGHTPHVQPRITG